MSELKADKTFVFGEKWFWAYPTESVDCDGITGSAHEVYGKSEVDAILAEKDAKILALDAEVFKLKHHAKLFFDERNYAEAQLRHHKYKRCLDKANYWLTVSYNCIDDEHRQKAEKHHYRWLKLAEKFKEA